MVPYRYESVPAGRVKDRVYRNGKLCYAIAQDRSIGTEAGFPKGTKGQPPLIPVCRLYLLLRNSAGVPGNKG
jgi:hypothetical protein